MSMWVENGRIMVDIESEKMPPDGEYLTVEEYAKSYSKAPETVYQWIHRGQLKAYNLSKRLYIPVGATPKKVYLSSPLDKA